MLHRNLNKTGFGGNHCMWWLKETLKAAGWTVKASGSGTNGVYATSDVFGSVVVGSSIVYPGDPHPPPANVGIGVGLEALGGPKCWFVMQDPDGNREILFTRYNSKNSNVDGYWWGGYSRAAGFTGGSADTFPSATDEATFNVSGTKDNPQSVFAAGTTANVTHVAADDTPSPAGEYGFFIGEVINPNNLNGWGKLDDLRQVATGEASPLALFLGNIALTPSVLALADGFTWADVGGGAESFLRTQLDFPYGGSQYFPLHGKVNLYDGKERAIPAIAVEKTVAGYLGVSRWVFAPGVPRAYPNTGDSYNYLYLDEVLIADLWDGSSTPLVV